MGGMESAVILDINERRHQKGGVSEPKGAVKGGCIGWFGKEKDDELRRMKMGMRNWVHSGKVGAALVVVSLLYFLDPLYKEVGDDNAIWAIMTVVVIFEFHAGATVCKGVNRVIGTVLGGGFGCLVASTGQRVGGIGNSIIVALAVFLVGGGATYYRQIHTKKVFDYGANIFILTFSLVAVSGLRIDNVIEIARERLLMIMLGFMTCLFTSLVFFPIWASDDLHSSLSSTFFKLATSLQGCVEEYFTSHDHNKVEEEGSSLEQHPIHECFQTCHALILAKSKHDSLVNSARWEPWHGKFGLSYPWDKYKQTGHLLNDLASSILSLKPASLTCPTPHDQSTNRESIREACEAAAASLAWTLTQLGDSVREMRRCNPDTSILSQLKSARLELSKAAAAPFKLGSEPSGDAEALGMATFVFGLTQMVDVLEELVKQVDDLAQTAAFHQT